MPIEMRSLYRCYRRVMDAETAKRRRTLGSENAFQSVPEHCLSFKSGQSTDRRHDDKSCHWPQLSATVD